MNKEQNSEDKFLISLSDIRTVFRKAKWKIIWSALIFGALGALWALNKPIKYKAEGTFREKSNKSGYIGGGLGQALLGEAFGMGSDGNEALSLIKSRKLMSEVIKRMNLQAQIILDCHQEGLLKRLEHNLKVEWGTFKKIPYPLLEDVQCPLSISNIQYSGEIPLILRVSLDEEGQYQIFDETMNTIGSGRLGVIFNGPNYQFFMTKAHAYQGEIPQEFQIAIIPMADLSAALAKDLEIENTKTDKGILKFLYENRDRHLASKFVNTVMSVYQSYIKEQHYKISDTQMAYLYKKKEESAKDLKRLMSEYADSLASDASTTGFIDSEKEMDFLINSQHELKQKLLANELDIKRLKNLSPNHYAYYDQYATKEGNAAIINNTLAEIRSLKQDRDGLELALNQNSHFKKDEIEEVFQQQLVELKQIQQKKAELQQIMQHDAAGNSDPVKFALLDDSHFLIQKWIDKINEAKDSNHEEAQIVKRHFSIYLANLERMLNVHEKILQERITHQQNVSEEYQGINLKTAHELYLEYCKKLNDEEASIQRTLFFLNQMQEDPDFEITSLSSVLMDHVSMGMITRASDLVLQLKDESNQSSRDQTRLKSDLKLQRMFLTSHLKQMIQLMELNKKLVSEKIYALQNVSLELVHQQISLLEKNLYEYVKSRLMTLEQERAIVEQHLKEIQQELALLPRKWVAEQLIDQQVKTNQSILEEIAKIVESKTISHNLEIIQSAPMDISLAPLNPKPPRLFLYTAIGMIFGGLMGTFFALARSLSNGIQVSTGNLKIVGQHVSGSLTSSYDSSSKSPLADEDLNTMRRLHAYFESGHSLPVSLPHALLLIEGQGPDYANDLASLFAKKGQKVLVMDLDFERSPNNGSDGLLQYLQGSVSSLKKTPTVYGDYVSAGGFNRFATEFLTSRSFKDLMKQLHEQYDWIFAVSHAMPNSADAESLTALFSNIAVNIRNETVDDLGFYHALTEDPTKKLTFIVTNQRFI